MNNHAPTVAYWGPRNKSHGWQGLRRPKLPPFSLPPYFPPAPSDLYQPAQNRFY